MRTTTAPASTIATAASSPAARIQRCRSRRPGFPAGHHAPRRRVLNNDVYLSEGGIGHLPDLCITVPVFTGRGGGVRAGVRPPRRHRRMRAGLDARPRDERLPGRADRAADQLYDAGERNEACSRSSGATPAFPTSSPPTWTRGAACLMGAGAWPSCSSATAVRPSKRASRQSSTAPRHFRHEILPKIPDGDYLGKTTSSTTASPIRGCTTSR